MSTAITKDIVCPTCGKTQKLELYTSINAEENPDLRRDILRESVFDWECRHCGYTAQMAYPTIYHDPARGFMICLRPSGAVSKVETIPAVKDLIKRSVKNPQELKEKILIFEAGLDDAAVELVKNAIVTVLRKKVEGNIHAYFCSVDGEVIKFALFIKGRQDPIYQTTQMAVYRQSQEVLRTLDYRDEDDFAVVNSKLAQRLLDQYKSI
ncbi:MAG: CpXC domain-containing protein [Clostridia bacterium]|nr:CpXC domain-containing protein [Clostridia bacterium]